MGSTGKSAREAQQKTSHVPRLNLKKIDASGKVQKSAKKTPTTRRKSVENRQITFKMCCFKRTDKRSKAKSLHFHECDGLSHNRREKQNKCITGGKAGKIYTPIELAVEAA